MCVCAPFVRFLLAVVSAAAVIVADTPTPPLSLSLGSREPTCLLALVSSSYPTIGPENMPIVIAIGIRLLSYALTHQMDERKSSSCVRPLLRPNFVSNCSSNANLLMSVAFRSRCLICARTHIVITSHRNFANRKSKFDIKDA